MIAKTITEIKDQAPLVHCLSATVSMGIVADGLLAAGARPMMTETFAEAPTLVGLADGLLINLGTLSTDGLAGMPATAAAANIPWVLDPAAVGPTTTRKELAFALLEYQPSIIRANASEILALANSGAGGRGPDANDEVDQALIAGKELASKTGAVVSISGAIDHIFAPDGRHIVLSNGSPLLPRVVGTGCLLGALSAAAAAVTDPISAAITAISWLNVTAEIADEFSIGPASFRTKLIDGLYTTSAELVEESAKLKWI